MPQATMQNDQFPNQFAHLQSQPNYLLNLMNISYPRYVNHQFGSRFFYQGLLDGPSSPFDTQTSNAPKGSQNEK